MQETKLTRQPGARPASSEIRKIDVDNRSSFCWIARPVAKCKLVGKCINTNPMTPATQFSKIPTPTLHDFHDFHEIRENRENREMYAAQLCFSFEAEWVDQHATNTYL